MKHVVTMKYWLINDGTFRCGVWMISIWLRSIIPYHFYSKATPTLGGLHSLRCHRLSYGLLCGWWSTGGAIFFDLELLSNVFLAMFSNKRDEFCVMCSLDPLDFSGDMKWRFHLPLIQKTRPYLLGGWRKTLKCCIQFRISWPMPDACLLGNSLLLGFLLDLYWIQGKEHLREVGSLPIALDVKFSATFNLSSLGMVSVELNFSCTQLELHHSTFLEMVCFLPQNSVPKRWTWTMSKKIEKTPIQWLVVKMPICGENNMLESWM